MANYSPKPGSTNGVGSKSSLDSFSFLSTPSPASSRSLTPSNPRQPPAVNQSGLDAFRSLLGPSFSSSENPENLSLAARQAAARREQQEKAAREHEAKQTEATVWNGLDMLGSESLNRDSNKATGTGITQNSEDDWLFDKIQPTASTASKPAASTVSAEVEDDWGLSDFANQTQGSEKLHPHTNPSGSIPLFDPLGDGDLFLDSFGEVKGTVITTESNGDVEDDILGVLGKPVASTAPSSRQPTPSASSRQEPARTQNNSPPPHIIGQIVEMGFTPQQARLALASTDTGLDVQQALDTLLSNGVGTEHETELPPSGPRRGLAEFQDEDDGWEEHEIRDTRANHPVQRQVASSPPNRTQSQPQALVSPEIQERADKLLAQASAIGFNVFNRANALWKDGKEKVQKVYEERSMKDKPPTDGRPRWMTSAPPDSNESSQSNASGHRTVFRDDDDVAEQSPLPRARERGVARNNVESRRTSQATGPKVADLFDEPAVYVSPARRRPAAQRSTSQTIAATSGPSRPTRQPSPPVLRTRQTVSASTSAISSANTHKAKGSELYKLGQFANAEQAYSAALSALPENHLLLVPLYNNRALTRIKIGDHSGAIEDCTSVLTIIGLDYHPAREARVVGELEGASVDLSDALVKALRRRAEAYEGRERWELAQKDWEAIVACDWSAKMRGEAFTGASRCRKMVSAEKNPSPAPPVPRPSAPRTQSLPKQSLEAVQKLRQANQTLEQEEEMKAKLRDTVDARLNAWKAGKETNVRALVASLETVLWPELGWQKVGLHELVTPSQVKIRYMKAIAKLHPDKIGSSDTTIEQRMIANGVFAALNDAWIAFKQ